MPELFEEELKKRKREARLSTAAFILMVVLLGLFFMALTSPISAGWKLGLGAAPIALFAIMWFWEKKREKHYDTPWEFSVKAGTAEKIAGWFSAEEVCPDTYFAFRGRNGISCRLLICRMDVFDSKAAASQRKKANKKINAQYGVKAEVPFWDTHKMLRTNLLLIPERTKDVIQWVNRTKITLTRAECVVNAAYIMKDSTLLLARLGYGFTISEINRYDAAVRILLEALEENRDTTNG